MIPRLRFYRSICKYLFCNVLNMYVFYECMILYICFMHVLQRTICKISSCLYLICNPLKIKTLLLLLLLLLFIRHACF